MMMSDAALVEPFARERHRHIGLVLVVGGQHLDVECAGGELLHRLFRAGDAGGPFTSRYGPDISLITPMRTTGRVWARRRAGTTAAVAVAASSERRDRIMTGSLAFRPAR